ncbi:unnamed protein product [Strongylus vulgaris]|uniref:Uncharacterized protein n=1 Tax=Strongylus vulgaris TaxID=40348 RepID=A0A3P7HYV8_STRVU|nr:unnamed protein product [Strongylus vulgaris]
MVLDPIFEGKKLKAGDWLFPDLFKGVEPIYVVKKIIALSPPLAYTSCFMNEIKVEFDCCAKCVRNLDDSKVIYEDRFLGNIVMSSEDYHKLRLMRMVCLLQFNHESPYQRPWTLVKFLRELAVDEEFPMLSFECSSSDSERRKNRPHRVSREGIGWERGNEIPYPPNRLDEPSSPESAHSTEDRYPPLEEALDIVGSLLGMREIYEVIERRSPWLLTRMHRFLLSQDEEANFRNAPYHDVSLKYLEDGEDVSAFFLTLSPADFNL